MNNLLVILSGTEIELLHGLSFSMQILNYGLAKQIQILFKGNINSNFRDTLNFNNISIEVQKEWSEFNSNYNPDYVYNFSFSSQSTIYFKKFAEITSGPILDNDIVKFKNKWIKTLFSFLDYAPLMPLVLSDFYVKAFLEDHPLKDHEYQSHQQVISRYGILFLVSSADTRSHFSPEKWASIILSVINKINDPKVYIASFDNVASSKIREFLSEYQSDFSFEFIDNFSGQKSIALLSKAELVISHPNQWTLLSQIYETPTLQLCVGSSSKTISQGISSTTVNLHPNITCYPCSPKKECNNYICHTYISSDTVGKCAALMCSNSSSSINAPMPICAHMFATYNSISNHSFLETKTNLEFYIPHEFIANLYRTALLYITDEIEITLPSKVIAKKDSNFFRDFFHSLDMAYNLIGFSLIRIKRELEVNNRSDELTLKNVFEILIELNCDLKVIATECHALAPAYNMLNTDLNILLSDKKISGLPPMLATAQDIKFMLEIMVEICSQVKEINFKQNTNKEVSDV